MARSIGRYEIREELGRGGMATVYQAFDPKLEREVALKLLDQQLSTDPTFVARFEREAKTVAGLEHSAIVSLYDYGEADGWLYLVMRYMKGGSLKELIARGPLTTRQAYGVVRRIGSALDKAHGEGVVHRDLKPGNILLDEEQASYLSDFGIVKVARGEAEYLTQTGQMLGTFAYMSPEQVMGREVDGRGDIYALGLVLYEMMTGKHPFGDTATSSGAMAVAHTQQPVPDIRQANPAAPAALNEVIQKAMAKNRDERYATCREMALAMYEALTRKPEAAATAAEQQSPAELPPTPIPAPVSVEAAPTAHEPPARQPAAGPEAQPTETRQPAEPVTRQPAAPVAQQASRPVTQQPASPPPAARQTPPSAAQPDREERRGIPIWLLALIGVVGVIGIAIVGAILIGGPDPEPPEVPPAATEVVEEEPPTEEPPTEEPPTEEPPTEEPPTEEPPTEEPPTEEPPTEEPPAIVFEPSFSVTDVVGDESVAIETIDFPPDEDFKVIMAPFGERGAAESVLGQINSGDGGTLQGTYPIPGELCGVPQIALRLEGVTSDYVAENWFYNRSASASSLSDGVPIRPLIFVSTFGGNEDVYRLNRIGGDPIPLTSAAATDRDAEWSPDGSQIVYTSNGVLHIMDACGRNTRPIPNSSNDWSPSWSPDGQWIAFQSFVDGDNEIYITDVDGNNRRAITDSPWDETEPSWFSDSRYIVYQDSRDGGITLYFIDITLSADPIRITTEVSDSRSPDMSPDGSTIVFQGSDGNDWEIYLFDGSLLQRLTDNDVDDMQPTWSADGRRIAFVSNRDGIELIYAMDAEPGARQVRVVSNEGFETVRPSWSP